MGDYTQSTTIHVPVPAPVTTNAVNPNARKCLECKRFKDVTEFESIGTKGRRRRKCVECYTPPVKQASVLNVITNTMNNLGSSMYDVHNYLAILNRSISEESERRRVKEAEESERRRLKEAEDQRVMDALTSNLNAVTVLIEDIPRQTNEYLTPINSKMDEMMEEVESNHEDATDLIIDIRNRFDELQKFVVDTTGSNPEDASGQHAAMLLAELAESIEAVRTEVTKSNIMFGERQANLAAEFHEFQTKINNNFQNLARVPVATSPLRSTYSPIRTRSPTTTPVGSPTAVGSPGSDRFTESILDNDFVAMLTDDAIKRKIGNLARLSTYYKPTPENPGNPEKFQIVRSNLNALRAERDRRK